MLNISLLFPNRQRFPSLPRRKNRGGGTREIVLLYSINSLLVLIKETEEVLLFFRGAELPAHEWHACDRRKALRRERLLVFGKEAVDGDERHATTILSVPQRPEGVQMNAQRLVHSENQRADRNPGLLRDLNPLASRLPLKRPVNVPRSQTRSCCRRPPTSSSSARRSPSAGTSEGSSARPGSRARSRGSTSRTGTTCPRRGVRRAVPARGDCPWDAREPRCPPAAGSEASPDRRRESRGDRAWLGGAWRMRTDSLACRREVRSSRRSTRRQTSSASSLAIRRRRCSQPKKSPQ